MGANSETHHQLFGGNIRQGAGHPGNFITSDDDIEIGDVFLDTTNKRLYANTTGLQSGWKYSALVTTSSSTSTSSSSSSTSSSSTTTMA